MILIKRQHSFQNIMFLKKKDEVLTKHDFSSNLDSSKSLNTHQKVICVQVTIAVVFDIEVRPPAGTLLGLLWDRLWMVFGCFLDTFWMIDERCSMILSDMSVVN